MSKYTLILKNGTKIIDSVIQHGVLAWPEQALDRFMERKKIPVDVYHDTWYSDHREGVHGSFAAGSDWGIWVYSNL